MPEALNPSQIAFFAEYGYLVVENRVPAMVMAEIRPEIRAEVARLRDPGPGLSRRIQQPQARSEAIDALMRSDRVLGPVRDILGPDVWLEDATLTLKPADKGTDIQWHRDQATPAYHRALVVRVFVDDLGPDNGPLMVFPGSHKGALGDPRQGAISAFDPVAAGLDPVDAVAMTGPAGSITIHHARTVYGALPSQSARDSAFFSFRMMAADDVPPAKIDEALATGALASRLLCGRPDRTPVGGAVQAGSLTPSTARARHAF
ncbi:phytanoyl-CoA dioxygenase family protein [Shimia biformata]|uniref:phytanoyl-CoA dioxygenase family protein n=1 Tax=Shimia biformata TaxID=1294299 RepID=UPI001950DD67|nr:phytanoyl-CoA dioxygenase family protein [Shimia biformata]